MKDRVQACLGEWIGQPVQRAEAIACHHNYTEREKHFGKQVWLSRKGAIDATTGTLGLIPGSMGGCLRGRERQPARAELITARRGPRLRAQGGRADVHACPA